MPPASAPSAAAGHSGSGQAARRAKTEPTGPRVFDARFVAGGARAADLPAPALAEVAFAGRSNVGKSSLMSALLDRHGLVRTSNTPGCTRRINVFSATIEGGYALHLVDLPGYGYAKVSKAEKAAWGPMLEGYLRTRPTLRAVVLLVDVRRGLEEDDRDLLEFLGQPGVRPDDTPPLGVFVVATKLDKLARSKQKPALAALDRAAGRPVLGFSAVTRQGRAALWTKLLAAVRVDPLESAASVV
jgi:GTP-binding protein